MQDEYLLKNLSFKSIFKLLTIPTLLLFGITLFWILDNQFLQQAQLLTPQSDEATKSLFQNFSPTSYKGFISLMFFLVLIMIDFVFSVLTWLSLKLYLFFFQIKLRGDIVPVVHDQMDAPVDDTQ